MECPDCGSENCHDVEASEDSDYYLMECEDCGAEWSEEE